MSAPRTTSKLRIDRMSNPLSHLSAVIATVACFVVGIMGCLAYSDPLLWRKNGWTVTFLVGVAIVVGSGITYFRPQSRIALIPVTAAVLLSALLVIWNIRVAILWYIEDPNSCQVDYLYKSILVFVACVPWAIAKLRLLRRPC